ncbi:hypothetical protein RLV_5673 [Rhizobium leguminosarum bv. viciae]|nr:hypothetical protein RLV_5673 [Rhizobium leguminosarum bv. viciae]
MANLHISCFAAPCHETCHENPLFTGYVAVIGGSGYPINNALSPPATGCDIIVPSEPEFRRQKNFSKRSGL